MTLWLQRVFWTAVCWGGLLAYALLSERRPNWWLLAVAVLGLAMLGWLTTDVGGSSTPAQWRVSSRGGPSARGFDHRFSRLAQELSESSDREKVAVDVHKSMAVIADDLLRSKYGVDKDGDPDAARQILGDSLSNYLEQVPRYPRTGYRQRLSALLDRMESL